MKMTVLPCKSKTWSPSVLLLLVVCAESFSLPRFGTQLTPKVASLQSTSSLGDDVEREMSSAIQVIQSCAKAAAVGGVVDIALYGRKMTLDLTSSPEACLVSIVAFWKLSLGANFWVAAKLREDIYDASVDDTTKLQGILTFLRIMTWVWRQCSAVIALAATVRLILVWQERIPKIQELLLLTIATMAVTTIYSSRQETKELAIVHNDRDDEAKNIVDSLRKQSRVTTRAMAVCITALWLRVASIPLLAVGTAGPLWKALLSIIPELPTPLGIASSLKTLRASLLKSLAEILQTADNKNTLRLKPETQLELSTAQTTFYGDVRKALITETILKVIAKVIAWKKGL